jgi:hypothetical protein
MNYMKAKNEMKPQISRVFVDGFYQWLRYFSKDKTKLTRALAHIFNTDCFFIAKAKRHQRIGLHEKGERTMIVAQNVRHRDCVDTVYTIELVAGD